MPASVIIVSVSGPRASGTSSFLAALKKLPWKKLPVTPEFLIQDGHVESDHKLGSLVTIEDAMPQLGPLLTVLKMIKTYKRLVSMEEKAKIREMVANAASAEEIDRIENLVKKGIFPGKNDSSDSIPPPPPPPPPPSSEDQDDNGASKRQKTE